MRFLLFTYEFPPYSGGIGRYCHELARETSGFNHTVVVLTRRYSPGDTRRDTDESYKIIRIPAFKSRKLNLLIGSLYFLITLRRFRPDTTLVTHGIALQIASFWSMFLPKSCSITLHGTDILAACRSGIKKWFLRRLCLKSHKVFVTSQYVKSMLTDRIRISEKKILIVHNGIDRNFISMPADNSVVAALRDRYHLSDHIVILTLARLNYRKGHDAVIRALPEVLRIFPEVKYVIVGEGPEEERLKKLVHEYKLGDSVIFTGNVLYNKVINYYDMCDIFIMPSTYEPFGITYLEAGARGKPVIGPNIDGVPELIVNGETGLLIDPHNIREIAHAITKILADSHWAEEMAAKNRERVLNLFTSEVMTQKILEASQSRQKNSLSGSHN
ncbi:MAG: glycosyltransferase family 4 protein [Sedimentisphaerales bacterium]|nr:glycosyltransferase family 4 protein [Sedimentisphaerales bacterium]